MVDYRPHKEENHITRLTVGGNLIDYPDTVSSPKEEMGTINILLKSVIYTLNSKFCTMDISNFYLGTEMDRPEYMFLPLDLIPEEFANEYQLINVSYNGKVYVKIIKGMYGLPQVGILENKNSTIIETGGVFSFQELCWIMETLS